MLRLGNRQSRIGQVARSRLTGVPPTAPINGHLVFQKRSVWTERLPMIIRPSFYRKLYPGLAARISNRKSKDKVPLDKARKEWNPATYFIWMFLLIGSQGINMIALKNDYTIFSRKADAKIALLKEVMEKIQRGEEVDVEKALGTGDEAQEQEWKDVLAQIEQEDRLWQSKIRKREKRAAKKAAESAVQKEAQPPDSVPPEGQQMDTEGDPGPTLKAQTAVGFY